MTPLQISLFGVLGLLGIGCYGLLITRNLIKVVIILQVLVKAVVLALVLAGQAGRRASVRAWRPPSSSPTPWWRLWGWPWQSRSGAGSARLTSRQSPHFEDSAWHRR